MFSCTIHKSQVRLMFSCTYTTHILYQDQGRWACNYRFFKSRKFGKGTVLVGFARSFSYWIEWGSAASNVSTIMLHRSEQMIRNCTYLLSSTRCWYIRWTFNKLQWLCMSLVNPHSNTWHHMKPRNSRKVINIWKNAFVSYKWKSCTHFSDKIETEQKEFVIKQ